MFLDELTHPTRTYYMLELPVEGAEGDEGSRWRYRLLRNHGRSRPPNVQTIGVLPGTRATASVAPCLSRCTSVPASSLSILLEVRAGNRAPSALRL